MTALPRTQSPCWGLDTPSSLLCEFRNKAPQRKAKADNVLDVLNKQFEKKTTVEQALIVAGGLMMFA